MSIEALKEEARRHEQREDWGKALDLYLRVIDRRSEEEEPEIALLNRVGDLQVRVGDVPGAISSYERAIDLYLEAGLPNNAIAICRKIIRNEPRRPDPFLRMGRIRAGQGFTVDARQNFLTYAEMMESKGKVDEALAALEEFAAAAPQDAEAREFLASQLAVRGREQEAVTYLTEAYRIVVAAGLTERADEILERLHAVAPDLPTPTLEEPDSALGHEGVPDLDLDAVEATSLEGFETTSLGAPSEEDREESVPEEVEAGVAPDVSSEFDPGSLPESELDEVSSDAEASDDRFDFAVEDEGEPEEDSSPLPYLTADEDGVALSHPSGAEGDVDDEGDSEVLDQAIDEEWEIETAADAPGEARDQAIDEEWEVETAAEGDSEVLEQALDEGWEVEAAPDEGEGADFDDTGEDASTPITAPTGGAPDEPDGGYVDLGSLVLDEPQSDSTRWTVEADAPSADEDADFKRMLSQFKEKVAKNLATDDAQANYDLGTAYKEMGLYEEAISQFQQALRADPRHLPSFEMLGQSFLERGEPEAAIRTLERGLRLPVNVEDELLGIYYCLGNSHEILGNSDDAREFYERIFALDINFMDVTERLRSLR